MNKPVLVITHERSGTHLLINIINYTKNGKFETIGYLPKIKNKIYKIEEYKYKTYRDIITYSYDVDNVCKSHHQIDFMEDYLDFIFDKFHVIYVKRDVRDVLTSYYKFLFSEEPPVLFNEWVFSKPNDIGQKYLTSSDNHLKGTDPHILVEPENYILRWKYHVDGWSKYKDNLLMINYEDVLLNFQNTKEIIENYIGRKIGNKIPDLHDKNLPNFVPNRGIVGGYKDFISNEILKKIDIYFI